jgi:hypothetical protein
MNPDQINIDKSLCSLVDTSDTVIENTLSPNRESFIDKLCNTSSLINDTISDENLPSQDNIS